MAVLYWTVFFFIPWTFASHRTMATTRLLLLLVSAIAQQYAFTAPSARPPSEELRELRGAEHAIPYVVVILSVRIRVAV